MGIDFQRIDSDVAIDLLATGSVVLEEDFASDDRNGDGQINDDDIPVSFALRNNAADDFPFIPNMDNSFVALYL